MNEILKTFQNKFITSYKFLIHIKSSNLYLKNNFLLQTFKLNISDRNCQKERALSGLVELATSLKVGLKWLPWGSDCHNLIQILSDNNT